MKKNQSRPKTYRNRLQLINNGRPLKANKLLSLLLLIPIILLLTSPVSADDIPAPTQKKGSHSDVATSDGKIRDDELIDYICEQINANGKGVKDVKLMVQSCYGGGLLDDMERAFGPMGACPGVPWIATSASEADKTATGYEDETVTDNEDTSTIGSPWTDALAGDGPYNLDKMHGPLRDGATGYVLDSFETAAANDWAGPNNPKAKHRTETPQWATGNGGDEIMWTSEGGKHEAIVFAGKETNLRHKNNVVNMREGLKKTWGDSGNVKDILNGTKQDLLDAIKDAASRLDENTQLVIYIDDHGTASIDMDETKGNIADTPIEDEISWNFDVPDGWFEGMFANYFSSNRQTPTPSLNLEITNCDGCSFWGYYINDQHLEFPGSDTTGQVNLPIPFYSLRPGVNRLEIVPQSSSTQASTGGISPKSHFGSLTVSRMELSTGPINEVSAFPLLVPGQSAAFFDPDRNGEGIFVELLEGDLALVYIFSYSVDGPGQTWMLGVGKQVGEGIIINNMLQTGGATFGPGFDPDDVVVTDFGSLAFHLPTCGTNTQKGSLFIYPDGSLNYAPTTSHNYAQLYTLVDCQTNTGSVNSPFSGSWFDPTHNGEGIILQVLENDLAVVQWFTYDSAGNQMWIQGTGTFVGNTLTVDNLFTTQGTGWGDAFDPDDVISLPWGTLEMIFSGCGAVVVNYNSSAGFGAGTLNMERISTLMGIPCVE